MKNLAFAAALLAAAPALQDPQVPKPGPHHEHLKVQVGTWDFTGVFDMGGQEEKMEGVQTVTLAPGGLWQVVDTKGKFGAEAFWGHGVAGYDAAAKKYVGTWIDSMSDYVQVGEGECSDDGKTLTMSFKIKSMEDPTKWGTMKEVTKVLDKDNMTLTFFVTGPDGNEMKIGAITYKRKK